MEKDEEDDVMEEVRILREKINKECPNSIGWRLVSLLGCMKELEKLELDFQSQCSSDCTRLQKEVDELDKMLNSGANYEDSDAFHHSFQDSSERLESVKKELATKLRAIVSLKQQLDEVPSQAELIQYPPKHLFLPLLKLTPPHKIFFELLINDSENAPTNTEAL
ncbi:coiled-coil domain-containing protein 93-like isoform X2 [Salvia splendens]|uniref:coiled-coil domain-containing protein 93-like isoform X2 n=1 Tax=Salvia splendens TaxID=180675 RepID=UPI001C252994|nr:coiled-coil domain-containing protein 93-like isoform X2 [Salvia splendens]